jgi:hypothetical protein
MKKLALGLFVMLLALAAVPGVAQVVVTGTVTALPGAISGWTVLAAPVTGAPEGSLSAPAMAQAQGDVTVTVTIKAADVPTIKEALASPGGIPMGRISDFTDVVGGVAVATDQHVAKWVKYQIKLAVDDTVRRHRDTAIRNNLPDVSTLSPAQQAALLEYLKTTLKTIK